ncbi:MAG: YigZ family protein [Culicoidibacterales bacterium]
MKSELYTVMEFFTYEITIERSRFITYLFPTDSNDEAIAAIKQINKLHYDASHNCTAYILGSPISTQKSSDDGEPKGTAGLPMVTALNYRKMTNITAIVTRYFGGIKLGAGGLIRAYSGAVSAALDHAPIASYNTFITIGMTISYDEINNLYALKELLGFFEIINTLYDTQIILYIELEEQNLLVLIDACVAHLMRHVDYDILTSQTKKILLRSK